MNGQGGNAWPSVSTISLCTGFSARTVQRALQNLVRDRWLEIAAPASQWRPTTYGAVLRGDMVTGLSNDSEVTPWPSGVTTATASGDTVTPEPLGTSREPLISTRASARGKKKAARSKRAAPDLTYLDDADTA
jgi:hypothetical protein